MDQSVYYGTPRFVLLTKYHLGYGIEEDEMVGYAKCMGPKRSAGSIDEETGKKCGPFKDVDIGGG